MYMKYRLLLLAAALIWGFAFVAQVVGMDTVGPFTFNGVRFVIGSLALLPFLYFHREGKSPLPTSIPLWAAFLMVGIPLFWELPCSRWGCSIRLLPRPAFSRPIIFSWFPSQASFWDSPFFAII